MRADFRLLKVSRTRATPTWVCVPLMRAVAEFWHSI
jgi:hypothetical protein